MSGADDPLRHRVDRLYEQEREERNERRGLEQRAATTIAASLVALGLILNGDTTAALKAGSPGGLTIIIGGALTILGVILVTAALAGAHTTENMSLVAAIRRDRKNKKVELEPAPLTDLYVTSRQTQVTDLVGENARLVPLLRAASLCVGVGAYLALVGAGIALLS